MNNYINILSKHTAKLTKEQLKAYSSWFFGAEDKALAPHATTSDTVAHQVNLDAPGNQGLVAICKIQLRRESVMLYHFLVNLHKTSAMTRFRMEQDEYTYVQAGDHSIEHYCGLILWAMIREEIWPMTKVGTNDLETQLAELSFTKCNTSVPILITKMMDIKHQIEAEKGNIYDTDHFMTLFFNKLSNYNSEMFHYEFISSRSNFNKRVMTMQEVFEALKTVYKLEQATGTWSNLMLTKYEITMLTTTLNKTKSEPNKLKSSGHGGGRGTGGDKGGRGAGRGNHGGSGRGSGATHQSQ